MLQRMAKAHIYEELTYRYTDNEKSYVTILGEENLNGRHTQILRSKEFTLSYHVILVDEGENDVTPS